MRKLPACATRLLLRFGPRDESVVGDLIEEYGSGRSRVWYWRQILSAILLTTRRELGADPLRAVVALTSGWATLPGATALCPFRMRCSTSSPSRSRITGDRACLSLPSSLWLRD